MEYNVVKEMLQFIYCGKSSSELNELASDLLVAADKYRFYILKKLKKKSIKIKILENPEK